MDGWERVGVEVMDEVFVGSRDGGFMEVAGGSFVCCAPVVVVGCVLDGTINRVGGWGGGRGRTADYGLC